MKEQANFDIEKMSQDLKMSEDQIQLYLVDMPRIERASGITEIKKAYEDATTKEAKIIAMKKWIQLADTIPEIQEAFVIAFLLDDKTSTVATEKWERFSLKEIESAATTEEAEKAEGRAPKGDLEMVAFKKKVSLIDSVAVIKVVHEILVLKNNTKQDTSTERGKEAIALERWNSLSLKDAKALTKSSNLPSIKSVYENAEITSEGSTIAFKKMGKILSKKIKSIYTICNAEYFFRYSIYFPETRKKIIKKWARLITFTAQAKDFYEITHSEVALQIWNELSLNDAKLASTENELKSVLEKVPPKSEAEILATKKIAKFYGYEK